MTHDFSRPAGPFHRVNALAALREIAPHGSPRGSFSAIARLEDPGSNQYLRRASFGVVTITEQGTDLRPIVTIWRGFQRDGRLDPPVMAQGAVWTIATLEDVEAHYGA